MKGCRYSARIALNRFLVIALSLCAVARADERDFVGVVTNVFDGDSFIVQPLRTSAVERGIEIRLMDIDAPEKHQPHADSARAALIALIDARRVFVDVITIDRYQRKVAKVYREPDRLDIARALVHDGHVWVDRKFARDTTLFALEDAARSKPVGLWLLPSHDRMPPWRFRALQRQQQRQPKVRDLRP